MKITSRDSRITRHATATSSRFTAFRVRDESRVILEADIAAYLVTLELADPQNPAVSRLALSFKVFPPLMQGVAGVVAP